MVTFGCCQNIKCPKRHTSGQIDICRRFTLAPIAGRADDIRCTCGCRQTSHLVCSYEVSGDTEPTAAAHVSSKAVARVSSADRARSATSSSVGGSAQFIFGNLKGNKIETLHGKASETSKFNFGVSRHLKQAVEIASSENSEVNEGKEIKKKGQKKGKKRKHEKADVGDVGDVGAERNKKARKSVKPTQKSTYPDSTSARSSVPAPAVTPSGPFVTNLCDEDDDDDYGNSVNDEIESNDNTPAAPLANHSTPAANAVSGNDTTQPVAAAAEATTTSIPTLITKVNGMESTLQNICTMVVRYYEEMQRSSRLMEALQERLAANHNTVLNEVSRICSFLDMEEMAHERFGDDNDLISENEEYP